MLAAKHYFKRKERCIYCDIISDTVRIGERIIYEDDLFLAFAPFAPRYPFETWVMPKKHKSDYRKINDEEITQLSFTMKNVLSKIRVGLNNPKLRYALHTIPNKIDHHNHWTTLEEDYHWHFEIVPILFEDQGFEMFSDYYINPVASEVYAKFLFEIDS